ncbi:MAG: hypothetical protein ACTHU0_05855 [Kofleriaceae bacterium]
MSRNRLPTLVLLVLGLLLVPWRAGVAFAEEEEEPAAAPAPAAADGDDDQAKPPAGEAPAADDDHGAKPAAADDDHGAKPADDDHGAKPAAGDGEAPEQAGEGGHAAGHAGEDAAGQAGAGAGAVEDPAAAQELDPAFAGIPSEPDAAALEKRAEGAELVASMTVEEFRNAVHAARNLVLEKMAKKIAGKSDQRMHKFSLMVFGFSLLGVLLLGLPLVLRKRYPGQGKTLFKYSALAAATFFVTVNLFGGVLFGLRSVQSVLSEYTNPSVAIAVSTFETLDKNAEDYIVLGKELFAPTLEQLSRNPDEQPSVALIENGAKLVKDAKVFLHIARTFKKVDFLLGAMPILLMLVTLALFVLAIRPTLTEIIKLPAMAASGVGGNIGSQVVRNSLRRVKGELLATLCTIGVLTLLTLLSGMVLGKIVGPALDALLAYFAVSVIYLQFVESASSAVVFLALIGVVVFLVLNLASVILSLSFFLGKSQKIFQARFNERVPLSAHKRFYLWGIPSVVLIQAFPWLFIVLAGWALEKLNDAILSGSTDANSLPWGKALLAGPVLLVLGFVVLFWAVRGIKGIKFLATYKIPKPAPTQPVA